MRKEAWEAILLAQKEGKLKSVGVSTFGVRHLKELADAGLDTPTVHQVRFQVIIRIFQRTLIVLQIDLHPFMARTEIVAYCKEREIALEVWPFTDRVVGHFS